MAGKEKLIRKAVGALGDLVDEKLLSRRDVIKGAGATAAAGALPTGARIAAEIAQKSGVEDVLPVAAKAMVKIPSGNIFESSLIDDAVSRHFREATDNFFHRFRDDYGSAVDEFGRSPQEQLVDNVRWELTGGGDLTGVPEKGSKAANQADEIMRSFGVKDPDKITVDELLKNDELMHELGKFDPGGESIGVLFNANRPGLKKYIETGDASEISESMMPMIDTLRQGGLPDKAIRTRLKDDLIDVYKREEPFWLDEDVVWDLEDLVID